MSFFGSPGSGGDAPPFSNFPPYCLTRPVVRGGQRVGDVRAMQAGVWSGTAPVTITRRWLRDGVVIAGQTGLSYTLVSADIGKRIEGEEIGTNAVSAVTVKAAGVVVAEPALAAPVMMVTPKLTGVPQVGRLLNIAGDKWLGGPVLERKYRWFRGGVEIAGAVDGSRTAVLADEGAMIAAELSVRGPGGWTVVMLDAVGPVAEAEVEPGPEPEPEPEPTIPLADMPEGVTVVGRWSANHSALTVDAGRVTQVTNLVAGMPAMVAQGLGRGALDRTDASGKRLLRFIGWELMEVPEGMGQLDNRNCTVIAVMRPYVNASVANHSTIVSLSNENGGTGTSGQGMARITMQGGAAKPSLTGQTTDSEACFAGAQLQVLTFAGRTTANGGSLILINNEVVHQGAQANTAGGGDKGIEIGRHPTASPAGPGNWALMDIYELVVIAGTVTNQQAADAAAALVAAYGIVPIEHTLIVDGASTFNGWSAGDPLSEVERGDNICGVLSEPGGPHALPANWRVIQQAVSGSTGIDLKTRRDAAAAAGMEPRAGGRNEVAWGFGFNDHGDGATGEDIVQRTRDLLTDGADAYLVKGWKCYPGINPSVGNSAVTNTLDAARALMFGAAQADFLDSVDAGASDTYEGMVEPWALHEWEVGGVAIFGSSGEAVNGIGTYYANDSVHMTAEGCRQLALSLRARMGF